MTATKNTERSKGVITSQDSSGTAGRAVGKWVGEGIGRKGSDLIKYISPVCVETCDKFGPTPKIAREPSEVSITENNPRGRVTLDGRNVAPDEYVKFSCHNVLLLKSVFTMLPKVQ